MAIVTNAHDSNTTQTNGTAIVLTPRGRAAAGKIGDSAKIEVGGAITNKVSYVQKEDNTSLAVNNSGVQLNGVITASNARLDAVYDARFDDPQYYTT